MKIIILFFVNLVFVVSVYSQSPVSEISGKILDKFTQQPLEDVVITLLSENQSIENTTSDFYGNFIFSNIKVGTYSIRYSLIGYKSLRSDNIIVSSGKVTTLFAELEGIETDVIIVEDENFSKPVDISNSFKNLSYEEIRRSPGGFEDIGRVLQILPGVSFVNDGRNDLIVRGGSPSENLFLIDNASVPNINHFGSQGSTGGPVSIINLDFIREVNFLTGGFSARYGDKLSSVLELKLREGNRQKFFGDINISATGFGAILEGPFGSEGKGSYLISAKRSYLDLIFNAAGFGFVPEYSSFQIKTVHDLNSKNFLTINAIGNIDKVRFNNETEENRQDNERILKNNQWGYINSFELKTLLSSNSYSLLNFSRNYTNYDFTGRDSNFTEVFKNKSAEGETKFKIEYFNSSDASNLISTGLGINYISLNYEILKETDTTYFINNSGQRVILPSVNLINETDAFKLFSFVQYSKTFQNNLKINAGVRVDYFDLLNDKFTVSPRASVSYPILKNTFVTFSYGIFRQSPSYLWIISDSENKKLKPLQSDHYVAGIEYYFSNDFKFTLEGYIKNYSNYPVSEIRPWLILANNGGDFEQKNDFVVEKLTSLGTGNSKGIELYIQKSLTENFYGLISLSFFDAKYKALDGIERPSSFNNKIISTIAAGYRFGDGWEISSKFRINGGRPYTAIDALNGFQLVSNYNSSSLPDFYKLDVRIDKRWNFSNWSLITYIDIQNVTNKKNITNYFWNKFKNEIEQNESIGILPSIGINAKF
ncbi:MAG TPA: TonB-dependent receptor [Ignavibacteria bacterium]|nr:TonB-dependent receptor [Ignavibacteria bacterium]